jgi:hypothetical protein
LVFKGALQLVPNDDALAKLAVDYQHMVDDGLFLDDAEPFDALLERCRAIQQKANVSCHGHAAASKNRSAIFVEPGAFVHPSRTAFTSAIRRRLTAIIGRRYRAHVF